MAPGRGGGFDAHGCEELEGEGPVEGGVGECCTGSQGPSGAVVLLSSSSSSRGFENGLDSQFGPLEYVFLINFLFVSSC